MMLFCQQKSAKHATIVAGIVVAAHCYLVWFVCLKTVTHHFAIPLSVPASSVRIKLNKSIPVVKKQPAQSSQSQNSKSVQPVQKTSQPASKKQGQKASAHKATNKSDTAKKDVPKKIEPKKSSSQETQKKIQAKEVEPIKKPSMVTQESFVIQQPVVALKNDQKVLIEQPIGLGTVDYYEVVHETILEQWRPPIGIVKGTSCTVSFSIDKKGVPVDIVFDKKSGVLMFDMSIKTVLARVTFSSLFVGNRFSILFTI